MKNTKITIIGAGNIGLAIAKGLISSGKINPENLTVTRRKIKLLRDAVSTEVCITSDNAQAIKGTDIIIIAVKPYSVKKVLDEIKEHTTEKQIIVSFAANVSIAQIKEQLLHEKTSVFRAMPNTAMELQESVTCIGGENNHTAETKKLVMLFNCLGETVLIREELMGAATVLGACGIAFALRFLRACTQGGIEIGFDAKTAQFIAAQTLKGASELVLLNKHHPEEEIDKVTTPQGVTISGLNEMEFNGFSSSLIKGLLTSYNKIKA